MHPRDAVLPADRPRRFKHFYGESTKLRPITRTMSRQRSGPSMLADAELPYDEGVYRKGGHVSTMASPVSGTPIKFMGKIFVDNTDLLTMLQDVFSVTEILPIAQANLDKWASLLIATGSALNPSKCYWYMISHKCRNKEWEYDNNTRHKLTILLPGGDRTEIVQLLVMEGKKMLGVWSSPMGSDTKHLQEVVFGKTSNWVRRLKNVHLPVHLAWKAY
jgi:hypothetical protein